MHARLVIPAKEAAERFVEANARRVHALGCSDCRLGKGRRFMRPPIALDPDSRDLFRDIGSQLSIFARPTIAHHDISRGKFSLHCVVLERTRARGFYSA